MSLNDVYADGPDLEDSTTFINDMVQHLNSHEEPEPRPLSKDVQEVVGALKSYALRKEEAVSVGWNYKPITSFAWHPSSSKTVLTFGDCSGTVGIAQTGISCYSNVLFY